MMAIVFSCSCGATMKARREIAGRQTKCPLCHKILSIPGVPSHSGVSPNGGKAARAQYDPDAIALDELDSDAHLEPSSSDEVHTVDRLDSIIQVDDSVADRPVFDPLDDCRPIDGSRQYKVLSSRDFGLTGKFNPAKLEETLNTLARKDWTVRSTSVIRVQSHSGEHDEMIVILER